MTCVRCGGFVIIDRYAWPGKEIDSREVPQAHCVNCGWIEDPVIRENRKLMAMASAPPSECPSGCARPDGVLRLKPRSVGSGRSSS